MVVQSMDRLARNLDDLRRLVQDLTKRGVRIEFVKEGVASAAVAREFDISRETLYQYLRGDG